MTVASYTTDLTDLYTDNQGTWTLISSGGGGQNALTDPETDDLIQGANCVSRNGFSSSIRGIINNIGATTVATDDAIYFWVKADIAAALNTTANGGIQVLVGSGTGAFDAYYVNGSDDAVGGWKCYVVDPTVTSSAQVGSPTATRSHFGARWDIPGSGPSKGFPFKIDAIRHGRFTTITNGTSPDPAATFSGLATENDRNDASPNDNRWGQFQENNGTYLFQGGLQLGTSTTAVRFDDNSEGIFINDTPFVSSGFNRIEINNASSEVSWTAITITALGTTSPGTFEVVDNATVTFDSCTFTDMGAFTFNGGTNANTITNTTFRRCGLVTQGAATFTGCTFESGSSTTLLSADTINFVTDCRFVSNGTGHAVDLGTIDTTGGDVTITWDNTLDDGAGTEWTGSTGLVTSGGSTNSALLFATTGTNNVIIDVQSGASIPTVRWTGTANSVDVQAGNVTTTVTVTDVFTGSPLQNARVLLEADTGGSLAVGTDIISGLTDVNGQITDSRSFSGDQPVTGRVRRASSGFGALYKTGNITGTISATTGADFNIGLLPDE